MEQTNLDLVARETEPNVRPGVRIHAGLPGAGKTQTMLFEAMSLSASGVPVILFDRNREVKEWIGSVVVCNTSQWLGVTRLKDETTYIINDELDDTRANYVHALKLSQLRQAGLGDDLTIARNRVSCGIAVPEAHLLLPKSGNLDVLGATTTWRHRRLCLWFDSQRLVLLNTTAVEISRGPRAGGLRIFPTGGYNDLKLIRAMGGDTLLGLVNTVNELYHSGRVGYYVDCGLIERDWIIKRMYPGVVIRGKNGRGKGGVKASEG